MYLLAIFLPPLAVLIRKGFLAAVLNLILCLFGFFPGVIHAFIVVAETNADKRTAKLESKFDELIDAHTSKKKDKIKKAEKPERSLKENKPSILNKVLTPVALGWFLVLVFFVQAFSELLNFHYLRAIRFFITCVIVSPPLWQEINRKFDKKKRNIAIVVAVVLFFLFLPGSSDKVAEEKPELNAPTSSPVAVQQAEEPFPSPVIEEVEVKKTETGFSEQQRKDIFLAVLKMEDEVYVDAEEFYPTDVTSSDYEDDNVNKKTDYIDTFTEMGMDKIYDEFKITEAQWKEILAEGIKKEWDL